MLVIKVVSQIDKVVCHRLGYWMNLNMNNDKAKLYEKFCFEFVFYIITINRSSESRTHDTEGSVQIGWRLKTNWFTTNLGHPSNFWSHQSLLVVLLIVCFILTTENSDYVGHHG